MCFLISLVRGLCAVYRTAAGKPPSDFDNEEAPHPAPEDQPGYRNNAHWLLTSSGEDRSAQFNSMPSKTVAYYDAASLYPSSGEPVNQPAAARWCSTKLMACSARGGMKSPLSFFLFSFFFMKKVTAT